MIAIRVGAFTYHYCAASAPPRRHGSWRLRQRSRATVDEIIRRRQESGDTGADDLLGMMLNTAQPGTGSAGDVTAGDGESGRR